MPAYQPCRRADLILQLAGSDTLLYDPRTDSVHILNPAAALIWDLCDGQHTRDAMAARLQTHFSATAGHDLHQDVQVILATLEQEGLLTDFNVDT